MAEDPDVAQARVFLQALIEETTAVAAQLDDARQARRRSSGPGNTALGLWHEQQLKAHKRTLRELSRQSENLRARFSLAAE